MKIIIKYESSWQNSFLDGSNNEPLPKHGRSFIGSMTNLSKKTEGKFNNYIEKNVSHDTIMGILNRLIGDQRKLYQSKNSQDYYFKDLENKITFNNLKDSYVLSHEIVYIRNTTGSTDQNSFSGMIISKDPIFTADYSNEFS
jgi:hypothetical protein